MEPLDFLADAIGYIEYEYKCQVMPMEQYLYSGDVMFYLNYARLYKLTPTHVPGNPLVVSLEKIFYQVPDSRE